MTISPTDAAIALRDIETAHADSRQRFIYRSASGHAILWGMLWIILGIVGDIAPARSGVAVLTAYVIGVSASIYMGSGTARKSKGYAGAGRVWAWRYVGSLAVCLALCAATIFVFSPASARQIETFTALLFGAVYTGMGIWIGLRYALIGAVAAGASLCAYAFVGSHFPLVIALIAGGSMMCGGYWLRRA